MCCRFYMEMSPKLRPIVEAAQRSALYRNNIARIAKPLTAEGEVFPDMLVPVLASNRAGEKAVFPMIWGYHFDGIRRTVANARSATAAAKPSLRGGCQSRTERKASSRSATAEVGAHSLAPSSQPRNWR